MYDPVRPAAHRRETYPRANRFRSNGGFRVTSRNDDLGAELLDVVNESEVEGFLARLVAEAARNAGRPIPADTGRALLPVLRRAAERTLPTLTIALGDERRPTARAAADRGPGLRAEREGMSADDRDFEIARQFVRFAQAAMTRAAKAPGPDPATTAADAIGQAGRQHAPALVPPKRGAATGP